MWVCISVPWRPAQGQLPAACPALALGSSPAALLRTCTDVGSLLFIMLQSRVDRLVAEEEAWAARLKALTSTRGQDTGVFLRRLTT